MFECPRSVHAAAGDADVAQQQLHHRAGADDLRADGVLRPAQRVQDGGGAVLGRRRGQHVADLQELVLGRAADALDHFLGVARVVLLQQLVDAARVFQRRIGLDIAVVAALVVPARLVIAAFLGVVARVQARVEREVLAHDEGEVRVVAHVLVLDLVVIQQILDDATQEDDVGAGAYGRVKSATDAERVKRGSTTMSFALLWALASVTHLNPQGWASAAFPPMISTTSAFLMSTQWFVIAPRPNVGARPATVGPCRHGLGCRMQASPCCARSCA